jgi:hypothetical protein
MCSIPKYLTGQVSEKISVKIPVRKTAKIVSANTKVRHTQDSMAHRYVTKRNASNVPSSNRSSLLDDKDLH